MTAPDEERAPAGGQSATEHLIRHGHTRIATIMGEPHMSAAQDRLKGYRRALATADIPFDPDLVADGNWSASAGYDATVKLLSLKTPPTAIFCQNDRMAIGCYEALKEAGLRIPQDMSVVGYDDEDERWPFANATGREGVFEAYCRPHFATMGDAVMNFSSPG